VRSDVIERPGRRVTLNTANCGKWVPPAREREYLRDACRAKCTHARRRRI